MEETKPALESPLAPATAQSIPVESLPSAPVDDHISIDDFMKIKLRVARIEAAEAVPKSSKMLRLQLDLGPLGKRQILSGIAKFYTPESLIGKHIVVVANLKPAKLMGLESEGMLLAASSDDGSQLVILEPTSIPPGSVVR